MKVSIAVPGKFHYFNYIDILEKRGRLESFVYSHKIQKKKSASSSRWHNVPAKEYLLQIHSKLFGAMLSDMFFPIYHELWASKAIGLIGAPDLLQVPMHGASIRLVKHARELGIAVLGEALNTHPSSRNPVIENEERKLFGKARTPQRNLWKRQLREISLVDHILTPSNWVKRTFVENGFDSQRIHVLPYAGNQSSFKPKKNYQQKHQKLKLLVTAGVTPRKGHHRLLEAVSSADLDIELLFAGSVDHQYADVLRSKWPNITFNLLGKIDHQSLATLFHEVDLFCLPTLEEGLAVSICEAMAAGLPTITTHESGAGEIIECGQTGLLYSSGDIGTLSDHLMYLSKNIDERERIGRNGAEQIKRRSNWINYTNGIEAIYASVLANTI